MSKGSQRPSRRDWKTAQKQSRIDEEIESFLEFQAAQTFSLALRTDNPLMLISALSGGVGMITSQFLANPTREELEGLDDAMLAMKIASGGRLECVVKRLPKRPIVRRG